MPESSSLSDELRSRALRALADLEQMPTGRGATIDPEELLRKYIPENGPRYKPVRVAIAAPDERAIEVAHRALAGWMRTGVDVVEDPGVRENEPGTITVRWADKGHPWPGNMPPDAMAVARTGTGPDSRRSSTVLVNPAATGGGDLQSILAHEMGHSLGLGHVAGRRGLMREQFWPGMRPEIPGLVEAGEVERAWARPPPVEPLELYPNPDEPPPPAQMLPEETTPEQVEAAGRAYSRLQQWLRGRPALGLSATKRAPGQ